MTDKEPREFFAPLESMRGIAALLVVITHIIWTHPVFTSPIIRNASLMVDLFFVLSGFVIFHSYAGKISQRGDLFRFMFLRMGRLYPLHLFFLFVFLSIETAKYIAEIKYGMIANNKAFENNGAGAFLANLFLLHSMGFVKGITFNFPSWSISVEFYAYLLFGLTVLLSGGRRKLVIASAIIITISAIVLHNFASPLRNATYNYGFFRCSLGFFIGGLTNQLYVFLKRAFPAAVGCVGMQIIQLALLAALIIVFAGPPSPPLNLGFVLLASALILATVAAPTSLLSRTLSVSPLTWLGKVSYSIYMSHAAVNWIYAQVLRHLFHIKQAYVFELFHHPTLLTGPVLGMALVFLDVATILLVSHFTYKFIEFPLREKSREYARFKFHPKSIAQPAVE